MGNKALKVRKKLESGKVKKKCCIESCDSLNPPNKMQLAFFSP